MSELALSHWRQYNEPNCWKTRIGVSGQITFSHFSAWRRRRQSEFIFWNRGRGKIFFRGKLTMRLHTFRPVFYDGDCPLAPGIYTSGWWLSTEMFYFYLSACSYTHPDNNRARRRATWGWSRQRVYHLCAKSHEHRSLFSSVLWLNTDASRSLLVTDFRSFSQRRYWKCRESRKWY